MVWKFNTVSINNLLNFCNFNTMKIPIQPPDDHWQAINWTRDNIIASATSIHFQFYYRPFEYLTLTLSLSVCVSFFGFSLQIKFSNCIWNMDSRYGFVSNNLYIFLCVCYKERPAHCCSCHLKYDEKRKKNTVGTFVIYTQ